MLTSHRARIEQQRLIKRIILTLGAAVGAVVILVYVGLPVLARLVLFTSSFRRDTQENKEELKFILPPVLDPLPEATNSGRIAVSGFAAAESNVLIFVNGSEEVKIIADKDGKFSTQLVPIKEGENSLYAVVAVSDSQSSPSATYTVNYKKNEPKLEISSPQDGDRFRDDRQEISIAGSTDEDNRVLVNDRLVIVDVQGNFSYSVRLSDGENTFKIQAYDDAGNKTEKELKVTYSP